MVGSRLQRIGSIFERVTGILRAGAMKESEKPIWYDVYKTFPPKHEPAFARPLVDKEIKPIFYPEDVIRGKFLKIYGSVDIYDLRNPGRQTILQRFVEKYQDLEKSGKYSTDEEIFKATESALHIEGIEFVRTKKISDGSNDSTDSEEKLL